MYATLMTPCFTSTTATRPHGNDNTVMRRKRLAEVRSLLGGIAQAAPAEGRMPATGLPEDLDAALTAWITGRAHHA